MKFVSMANTERRRDEEKEVVFEMCFNYSEKQKTENAKRVSWSAYGLIVLSYYCVSVWGFLASRQSARRGNTQPGQFTAVWLNPTEQAGSRPHDYILLPHCSMLHAKLNINELIQTKQ